MPGHLHGAEDALGVRHHDREAAVSGGHASEAARLQGARRLLGIGLLSNSLIANGIDYVLYPWVIWTLGPLHGAAMMTVLSFLICWATLLFYDWAKKDWLGIETIKELKEYAGNSRFARVLRWAVAKGDAASSRCGPTPSSPWPICARAHTNTTA